MSNYKIENTERYYVAKFENPDKETFEEFLIEEAKDILEYDDEENLERFIDEIKENGAYIVAEKEYPDVEDFLKEKKA